MKLIDRIQEHKNRITSLEGRKQQVEADLNKYADLKEKCITDAVLLEKTQCILQDVTRQTQEKLRYHLSELGTLALKEIFPEPYELGIDFVLKRNKTECIISLIKDGIKYDPMKSTGGGAVDVVALALRLALWSLKKPKSQNLLILDEPLKFLSKDLQFKAGKIIEEITKRLGVQLIMVTHETDLIPDDLLAFYIEQNQQRVSYIQRISMDGEEKK